MDQILLSRGISESTSAPEKKSIFSQLNPLQGFVDQVMGNFLDTNVFVGSGRSLYVWRLLMHTLKQYTIADEKNYMQVEAEANQYLSNLKKELNVDYFDYWERAESELNGQEYSNELNVGIKTCASEFIFCCIQNNDRILNKSTDVTMKRKIGNFLMHAINIEKDEYEQIEATFNGSELPRRAILSLNYVPESDSGSSVSQSIVEEIVENIEKFENVKYEREVPVSSNSTKIIRKSPWHVAAAFKLFCERNNLWNVRDGEIEPAFDSMYNQLYSLSSSSLSFLFSERKRTLESSYKLCHVYMFMRRVIKKEGGGKGSELYIKLMYDIPQIIAHGCAIDKYKLVDVNFRYNLDRLISIANEKFSDDNQDPKNKPFALFMKFVNEPRKYLLNEFHDSIPRLALESPEEFMKQKMDQYLKFAIHSAMTGFTTEVYDHFLHPKQMAKITIPLLLSTFIEYEFSFYIKRYSPQFTRKFLQYLVYSVFPVLLSGLINAQGKVISSL